MMGSEHDTLIDTLTRALQSSDSALTITAGSTASADDPDASSLPDASRLSVERLAALVVMLATAPAIATATPPGVTKGRVAALLAPDERRHASAIMQWLDRAGVLVEPRAEALRWREPRLFCCDDVDRIVARVRSTFVEQR